ncbi:MAG: septum formation initiator family protein [Candidatus Omnitrophica bacterium]|nr:septum formation initiator family protein [Candidatus Omnitrophota bacterium]
MEKKKIRIAVIAAVIIALVGVLLPGYSKLQDLVAENRKLAERITQLTRSVEDLETEKEKLESDILYIEKIARDKLGVVREDEVVIEEVTRK